MNGRITREQLVSIVRNALLAFALISLGFVLGKHSSGRHGGTAPPPSRGTEGSAAEPGQHVRVYYLHATFRCTTCNTIEAMTRKLLEREFGDELATGRMEWVEADFQKQEELAEQFEIVASCVVVARMAGERVLDYSRLDEVWTLIREPAEFDRHVAGRIQECLSEAADGSGKL